MKKVFLVIALLMLTIGASGCADTGTNKDVKEVNIGYFPNVSHGPAMVGVNQGFFTKEMGGIKLNISTFPDGSLFMDALSTGVIDFGYVGPGPVINRYLQGGEFVLLDGVSQGENVLVVRNDIEFNSLKDLEGKIVATASTGCTHDLILRKMLQEDGLAVEGNGGKVKRIAQKPSTTIGLFEQKQIDAAVVSEPWASIMESSGAVKVVVDANDVPWDGNLPATVLVARKDFVDANPEMVEKIITANRQAIDFINNNNDEAVNIMVEMIKEITGEETAKDIMHKSMGRIKFTSDLDRVTLQEFADLTVELGFIDSDSTLDSLYNTN